MFLTFLFFKIEEFSFRQFHKVGQFIDFIYQYQGKIFMTLYKILCPLEIFYDLNLAICLINEFVDLTQARPQTF